MAKKQDAFYFETFVGCMDHACTAAEILSSTLQNFDPASLKSRLADIHKEEHAADCKKHDLMEVLAKAFITPIEREDILSLAHNVDEVVDKIEDVLLRLYCSNIRTLRPDAVKTVELIVKACTAVRGLMVEFADFRRSKKLRQFIVEVNNLEEEGDGLFLQSLRQLHVTCTDPLEVFAWHELYTRLEQCLDACEHVADVVESVIMKNS